MIGLFLFSEYVAEATGEEGGNGTEGDGVCVEVDTAVFKQGRDADEV